MIDALAYPGPLAPLRAQAEPIPLQQAASAGWIDALLPPDPTAPTGPRPTFEATPLERLRETRLTDVPRMLPGTGQYSALGDMRGAPSIDRTA